MIHKKNEKEFSFDTPCNSLYTSNVFLWAIQGTPRRRWTCLAWFALAQKTKAFTGYWRILLKIMSEFMKNGRWNSWTDQFTCSANDRIIIWYLFTVRLLNANRPCCFNNVTPQWQSELCTNDQKYADSFDCGCMHKQYGKCLGNLSNDVCIAVFPMFLSIQLLRFQLHDEASF